MTDQSEMRLFVVKFTGSCALEVRLIRAETPQRATVLASESFSDPYDKMMVTEFGVSGAECNIAIATYIE